MDQIWGKIDVDRSNGLVLDYLPLADHCIDVASVFRELSELPSIRRTLERSAGRSLDSVDLDRLAVYAFFHDMGKTNWGFQSKKDPFAKITASHSREVAPLFFNNHLAQNCCSAIDCETLISWLEDPETFPLVLIATISHHGQPVFDWNIENDYKIDVMAKFWEPNGNIDPMNGLRDLGSYARRAFPKAYERGSNKLPFTKTLEHRFAGLVMLADWLGSHREAFFPYRHEGDRVEWSRGQARKALEAVGLDVSTARSFIKRSLPQFNDIFGFDPYPLQAWLANADRPNLLIAESDTGSGKTEAALAHFLALFAAGEVDSLYFALPTRVAARELYGRVMETMNKVFKDECPPVLLAVPGYIRIDGEPLNKLPSEKHLLSDEENQRAERSWTAERSKRFLAAPVAVGTIDQALLSCIKIPHAHLRRICLDRALLVIDEVHSSDVYMRAISRHMLSQHLAVGGRALLLSATLGSVARVDYLYPQAYSGIIPFEQAVRQGYPAISVPGEEIRTFSNPSGRSRRVILEPVAEIETPVSLLPRVVEAVKRGQRVLMIFNTVKRAISMARIAESDLTLARSMFTCNQIPCPHHGRFSRIDREILDKAVSQSLGKGSPEGAILLIGTQTLEQSLDIDADWLVTDLCPMDVLLQRIGRLHRHDRGTRPVPTCTVLLPPGKDFSEFIDKRGEVIFGASAGLGSVYEDLRILQVTRDLVAEGPIIDLPRENRILVEKATHPERLALLTGDRWAKHQQHLDGVIQAMLMAADGALIPDEHFGEFMFPRRLETRLATRLGLDDRILSLGGSFQSPFGRGMDEINIPGHMARGLVGEQADLVKTVDDGLVIHVGNITFQYSRFGLEKIDEPAN